MYITSNTSIDGRAISVSPIDPAGLDNDWRYALYFGTSQTVYLSEKEMRNLAFHIDCALRMSELSEAVG